MYEMHIRNLQANLRQQSFTYQNVRIISNIFYTE